MNFHVTVGRGTEKFSETEIKGKLCQLDKIQVRDGKILFQTSDSSETIFNIILDLKSVERAFVTIADYENKAEGKRDFLNKFMETFSFRTDYDMIDKVLNQLSSVLCQNKLQKADSKLATRFLEPVKKKRKLQDNDISQHSDIEQCSKSNDNLDFDSISKNTEEGFKTFRMSMKCSGKAGRWIDVKRLCRDLSWRISKASKWKVELKKPDIEICLHINDNYVTAGIPITKTPLSRRSFILHPGLRSPVAWIMVQLAQIQSGNFILDPMCGKGTLLLEASSIVKDAFFMGADIDPSQLQTARQNMIQTQFGWHIDLLLADTLSLPLDDMSVDSVICDAPFNQNHLVPDVEKFYQAFLKEMWRVLKRPGRFVFLTSQEISRKILPWLETIPEAKCEEEICPLPNSSQEKGDNLLDRFPKLPFKFVSKDYVKLGETHGEIIVMNKEEINKT